MTVIQVCTHAIFCHLSVYDADYLREEAESWTAIIRDHKTSNQTGVVFITLEDDCKRLMTVWLKKR